MAKKSKITITIDGSLLKKLREYRAKKIKKNLKGISLSQVIEDLSKAGLKYTKKETLKVISQAGAFSAIFTAICIDHGMGHAYHYIENFI